METSARPVLIASVLDSLGFDASFDISRPYQGSLGIFRRIPRKWFEDALYLEALLALDSFHLLQRCPVWIDGQLVEVENPSLNDIVPHLFTQIRPHDDLFYDVTDGCLLHHECVDVQLELAGNSPYILQARFNTQARARLCLQVAHCILSNHTEAEACVEKVNSMTTTSAMPSVSNVPAPRPPVYIQGARLQLSMVLGLTEAMYRHRNTLTERVWVKALATGKKLLRLSQQDANMRKFIAEYAEIWNDFLTCFRQALPEIERQCCVDPEIAVTGHEDSNAALMIRNQVNLMADLERLNDLLSIARNLLSITVKAQNLAAEASFDQEVLKLIDLCVRVVARGYDGHLANNPEDVWQTINNSFKKLLITSLQLLHNFIMHNEHRKLLLWLDLFGNSKSSDPYFTAKFTRVTPDSADTTVLDSKNMQSSQASSTMENAKSEPAAEEASDPERDALALAVDRLGRAEGVPEAKRLSGADMRVEYKKLSLFEELSLSESKGQPGEKRDWAKLPRSVLSDDIDNIQESDTIIAKTPSSAAQSLKDAKELLMARLVRPPPSIHQALQGSHAVGNQQPREHPSAQRSEPLPETNAEDEEEEYEEEDELELAYPSIGDVERGLLTDVPLVLGLQEIEALPMIIKAGITPDKDSRTSDKGASERKHMAAVRCNILLAQDAGRNLLRELLIFIAAWDLQDDEFYFKLMIGVMEAILHNGLMPFAYQTFGEPKEIVSPAQAIIIKLLTQLFRKKQYTPPPYGTRVPVGQPPVNPQRVDLLIVRYIFTVFRQSIIPETCALIYLQGQIRLGAAPAEDFPLGIWDMERVYEGIYQFLEFFAVLTENEVWKELLVKWEIVSELVTLLRELDTSIPKAPLTPAQSAREAKDAAGNTQTSQDQPKPGPAPGLVERPYDPVPTDDTSSINRDASNSGRASPSQSVGAHGNPATFEWRNLKKLVVLVLSSLVWKSYAVQGQIRQYGGVEMVLSCCNYDANNPYIREHAIMCLRFLLENSPQNQEIVEKLEARRAVPSEVLDSQGFETYIDEEGKVGLRAKETERAA